MEYIIQYKSNSNDKLKIWGSYPTIDQMNSGFKRLWNTRPAYTKLTTTK